MHQECTFGHGNNGLRLDFRWVLETIPMPLLYFVERFRGYFPNGTGTGS